MARIITRIITRISKRLLIPVFALFAVFAVMTPHRNQSATQASPTFNKEVVRILQQNCQTCHRPGDIGPMSLLDYAETKRFATLIKTKTQAREMPPWKPVPGCGEFRDSRQMSDAEIATLAAWADTGAPAGNPADLPAPINFGEGWALGTPDLVLSSDEDYTPPTDSDMYRCFTIPTTLRGDRYISAIDVKPGNRRIVHHVIAYLDPNGESVALDAKDPGPGYTSFGGPGFNNTGIIGGWAPGGRGYAAGEGNGIKIQNNSRVVIQVHYHPTGAVEKDHTQVAVYFARSPVQKDLQLLPLVNQSFNIPAGEKHYQVTASYTNSLLPAHIVSITPHMHLLGREIKVEMTLPAKPTDCLINIDNWDFQWQGTYIYKDPLAVPVGTKLKLTSFYDNSVGNPLNPNNPAKAVRWGEATTDEMCLAFIGFTIDGFNIIPSTPQIGEVTLDSNNNLVVTGSGFQPGADIEINRNRLHDTRIEAPAAAATKLLSSEMWRVAAAPGQMVEVTVINPDGVRTTSKVFVRGGNALSMAAVSAANYSPEALAPEAIAAAFGTRLAITTEVATTLPLPTTLGSASVRVNGLLAPLFFVSAGQVNFLVPPGTQNGVAVVEVTTTDGTVSRSNLNVTSTAPGIFTANASGNGAPAAVATPDGVKYNPVGNSDGSANPIHASDYLVLFGTGIRRAATGTVKITIGGLTVPVLYAGAQPDFVGLDQLNTQVPPGVTGLVDLVLTVNGRIANAVKINVTSPAK